MDIQSSYINTGDFHYDYPVPTMNCCLLITESSMADVDFAAPLPMFVLND